MGFLPDVKGMTAKLEDHFQQLVAELRVLGDKLDGILDELRKKNQGGVPLAVIILVALVVVLIAGLGVCGDALFEDEDEKNDLGLVRVELASHEYDDGGCWDGECYDGGGDQDGQWNNDQRNHNRRNRGAFSPGPFDDSPVDAFNGNTICLPGSNCYTDDRQREGERPR